MARCSRSWSAAHCGGRSWFRSWSTKSRMRDGRWVIPDLVGKRKRVRTVPVPDWVKDRLDHWIQAAEIREGKIFRAVGKNDNR